MNEVITHTDVTTLMGLVADIRDELRTLVKLVEEDDDEEETDDEDS